MALLYYNTLMTLMCLENSKEKVRNVKLMLYMFEQMSGLKINFKNFEVVLVGGR
jgi:hypothetical protein